MTEVDKFLDWLASLRPIFQQATCCDFAIGSHYNLDGTVGGDIVPPHAPAVDEMSGIVSLDYRMLQEALATLRMSR